MKKIISLLMAMLLVFSSVSVFAETFPNDVEVADISFTTDGYVVDSTSAAKAKTNTTDAMKNKYMVYQIPVPEIADNQIFSSFKLSFYGNRTESPSGLFKLYKMPGESYVMDTNLRSSSISSTQIGTQLSCEQASSTSKNWKLTYDITDYANECIRQSYIYIGIKGPTSSSVSINGSKERTYSFTPTAIPAISLESASLSDGAEDITTDTEISFTYSSPVTLAVITLNGEQAACNVASNVVTLTSNLSQLTEYDLSIVATDSHAQSDEYEMSFTTGIDKDTFSANMTDTKLVSENALTNLVNAGNNVDHESRDYAYFKMPLPEIGSDGLIDKYTVRFYSMMDSTVVAPIQIFALPDENWDDSLTVNSDAFAAIVADYDTYGIKNSVKYIEKGSNGDHLLEADLTEFASKCLAEGHTSIAIAINSKATFKVFGNTNYSTTSYRKPVVYAEILTNPDAKVYDVTCKVPGNTLREFSFKLLKKAPGSEAYVKLVNLNNEEHNAEFDYNPYTRTVYLASPVALDEETTYRIIIESVFDSSVSENIVVSEFTTSRDFGIKELSLVLSDGEYADYSEAEAQSVLVKGSSYKYVTEITNNTGDNLDIIMAIGVYSSVGELVDFVFETADISSGTALYCSKGITIPQEAYEIKAFAWDKNYDPLTKPGYALATSDE